jgi:hypothetical protein
MGQALYDAREYWFESNVFYNDKTVSPFLTQQDVSEGTLYQFAMDANNSMYGKEVVSESGDKKWILEISKTPLTDFADDRKFNSIEQVEDAVLAQATLIGRHDKLTVFALNAQMSTQAQHNRRGEGWVAMMHPTMFEQINSGTPEEFKDIWLKPKPRTIGRWTLIANKVDRCAHVWVADHLDDNVIYTAYRSTSAHHKTDGIVCGEADGMYYLGNIPRGYIHKSIW